MCRDIVDYEVYGGSPINALFVRPDLFKIFAFRQSKLRELFPETAILDTAASGDLKRNMGMAGKVLLTGASGYVGGRLLRLLCEHSIPVRCLARHPEFLSARVADTVEVVRGDVLDRESLSAAMAGVESAYYFVHSMGSADDFEEADRRAAQNFAEAAREAGVKRIIYLGGLGDEEDQLSPHLRSRHEVGQLLRSTGVQVIEFRASIVLGSGSLSFEMIRALVEKLPIMITPRWVAILAQPIAIEDLLKYLVAALQLTGSDSHVYEIGGADQVSYGELMREYARQRGLRRLLIRVPVLTPRLSSLWLGLVTPLYARIGRKLIDSIRHPTSGARSIGAGRFRHSSGWLPRGDCCGIAKRGPGDCGNPLVGRSFLQRCDTLVGRCTIRQSLDRLTCRVESRVAGARFCPDSANRRRPRMVLRRWFVEAARTARPAGWRRRASPRSPRSGSGPRGRHHRLLAS